MPCPERKATQQQCLELNRTVSLFVQMLHRIEYRPKATNPSLTELVAKVERARSNDHRQQYYDTGGRQDKAHAVTLAALRTVAGS